LPSASAPWGPPNNKKTAPVAFEQQRTRGRTRFRSCQFDEYFNRLTLGGMPDRGDALFRVPCHKKKSCSTLGAKAPKLGPGEPPTLRNQACQTVACRGRQVAPFTGHSGEVGPGPLLDQVGSHVYSPIIRTGHSPPSQLSTLDLVVAGKGFLCLRCKEGGNLVDDLCVTCGCSCFNSPCSHHILWQHQICSYVVFLS
jgi:hypothetical protein